MADKGDFGSFELCEKLKLVFDFAGERKSPGSLAEALAELDQAITLCMLINMLREILVLPSLDAGKSMQEQDRVLGLEGGAPGFGVVHEWGIARGIQL